MSGAIGSVPSAVADGSWRVYAPARRADLKSLTGIGLFLLPIRDVDCDFRLIRRSVVAPLTLTVTSGAICVELVHELHRNGCRFTEAPVHHYPRPHGRSEFFTPGRVIHTAFDFVRLWLRVTLCRV